MCESRIREDYKYFKRHTTLINTKNSYLRADVQKSAARWMSLLRGFVFHMERTFCSSWYTSISHFKRTTTFALIQRNVVINLSICHFLTLTSKSNFRESLMKLFRSFLQVCWAILARSKSGSEMSSIHHCAEALLWVMECELEAALRFVVKSGRVLTVIHGVCARSSGEVAWQ